MVNKANKIRLIFLTLLLLLLLLFSIFAVIFFWTPVKVPSRIIYVPSNYARIQWAVDNASAGDTIIVNSGIYSENVIIDKSLTLLGENGATIIDGNGTCHVVTINADNVTICGFTIQNSGPIFGNAGVCLSNSRWCNISYNTLTRNYHGIWVNHYSSNNIIAGNNIYNNSVGIGLVDSSGNIVMNNNINSSKYCGMGLSNASNTIIASNIAENNEYGIWLSYCTNFTIVGNILIDNWGQIYLNSSYSNTIFHNNFIDNTHQTEVFNSTSIWDNDFEGNYWSDYVGIDANHDGIGDSAYKIDANNADNYPLMGTFSDFIIAWKGQVHHVTTICNSTISNFNFDSKAISFNVTGKDKTVGFCRICIPTALMNGNFTVYVDGIITPHKLLPRSNATCNYLCITYTCSTKNVKIIPELSLIILPLLMVLTLVAIIIKKEKLLVQKP